MFTFIVLFMQMIILSLFKNKLILRFLLNILISVSGVMWITCVSWSLALNLVHCCPCPACLVRGDLNN